MGYCIVFNCGADGRGMLEFHDGDRVQAYIPARTGSVNTSGELVNAIDPGHWYVVEQSISTREPAMIWRGDDRGWKIRLWKWDKVNRTYEFTHYLIHPDGNLPGTQGCIGILDNGVVMRGAIDVAQRRQLVIPAYIGIPRPVGTHDDRSEV